MDPAIGRASPDEAPGIERLLAQNQLPVEGVSEHIATALVARAEGQLVGSAALERYADGVLLRSVAVAPAWQHRGLGQALTHAAIRLAGDLGAPAIYLLTTTAEPFFLKFGFEPIARDDVPATVRTSVEFVSACPASATVMRKRL